MSVKCWLDCVGPVEPRVSRWPGRLYVGAGLLALTAIGVSGLGLAGKLVITLAALAVAWWAWRRQPRAVALRFSPQGVQGRLSSGQALAVELPFRCTVTRYWVSVQVPALPGGWLTLFADQLDADQFRQLRRVLWLGRRRV